MIRKQTVSAHRRTLLPFVSATIFSTLFIISVVMFWRQAYQPTDSLIHQDIVALQKIFQKINKDCKTISFAHEKNYIDFLTVKEFVGSQVGSINLAFPKFWKGPYLNENPEIQGHAYVILKNKQGYFIVPDNGVVLGNGKVIGKDIILNCKTDMKKMLQDLNGLKSSAGALAAPVEVVKNSFMLNAFASDFFTGNE